VGKKEKNSPGISEATVGVLLVLKESVHTSPGADHAVMGVVELKVPPVVTHRVPAASGCPSATDAMTADRANLTILISPVSLDIELNHWLESQTMVYRGAYVSLTKFAPHKYVGQAD
jgi:hypothetical protein